MIILQKARLWLSIKPVYEPAEEAASESARLAGFRVLLHETRGRDTEVCLASRFPIRSAGPVNLFDQPIGEAYQPADSHLLRFDLDAGGILAVSIDVDFDALAAEN